jgi:hypothetical protein
MYNIFKDSAGKAWCAWLGYYNSMMKKLGCTKEDLVELSRDYASSLGMNDIPAIPKRTLAKMGLSVSIYFILCCVKISQSELECQRIKKLCRRAQNSKKPARKQK